MSTIKVTALVITVALLSACGLGETAAQAELQAKQAQQLQEQKKQLEAQINAANALNNERLKKATEEQ